jgi:hypothetical protein
MQKTKIKDARIGEDVEEFVFLGYTSYKKLIETIKGRDKINIDYVK